MHNSPPCCHGLDHAATRIRACELIVKLPWRTIQKRPAKSKWAKSGLCLDWHTIAQGVFALSGTLFATTFNKMVKRSMTASNAECILTDPVTVEANSDAVQGLSACNKKKGFEDKMTFFYIRALAINLELTRWLTRWFFQ